jgi:hypothetical protein
LEKRNSELSSSAQSSSAFRAEGRRARKAVQAALQQVRDIFQMILVDAQLPLQEKDLWTQQRGKGSLSRSMLILFQVLNKNWMYISQ